MILVLFGIGSSLSVDIEESAHRAGHTLAAGIRNRPGPSFLADDIPIVACEQATPRLKSSPYLVPIFTPANRATAQQEAAAAGFDNPGRLIDPGTPWPRHSELGDGSYVNTGCSIGSRSSFGLFCLINRGASIGHHAAFDDFVSIGPGAVVAGHVTIGDGATIGAGAIVLPSLTIGAGVVVGAGAVVTRDVPPGCHVIGNPARQMDPRP